MPTAAQSERHRSAAQSSPRVSVVLVMQDGYPAIRRTVHEFAKQTIADELELVIVAPGGKAALPDDEALQKISTVTVVELDDASLGGAQAEGVRRASGPVVILGEDHAWPEPHYAQALAESCKPPYAAVGPAMVNANPWSMVSWANLLLAYGRWTDPVTAGPISELPGTNTAYRRDVLLAYGEQLDLLMAREGGLLRRLQQDGHKLYLEPRARTAHQNVSGIRAGATLRFCAGRLYAAKRAEGEKWSLQKRVIYTAASPLIPVVRFVRIFSDLRQRKLPLTPRVLAGVGLGVTLDGVGQMAGYSLGPGQSLARLEDFEFNRYRYLSKRDRREAGL